MMKIALLLLVAGFALSNAAITQRHKKGGDYVPPRHHSSSSCRTEGYSCYNDLQCCGSSVCILTYYNGEGRCGSQEQLDALLDTFEAEMMAEPEAACRPDGEPCDNDHDCCGVDICMTYNDKGEGNCINPNEYELALDELEKLAFPEAEKPCMTEGIGNCTQDSDCCGPYLYCDMEFGDPVPYGACMMKKDMAELIEEEEAVAAEPQCLTEGEGDCKSDSDCCGPYLYCDMEFGDPVPYGACMMRNNVADIIEEQIKAVKVPECMTEGIGNCAVDGNMCCDGLFCDVEFEGTSPYGACMIRN